MEYLVSLDQIVSSNPWIREKIIGKRIKSLFTFKLNLKSQKIVQFILNSTNVLIQTVTEAIREILNNPS